MPSNSIRQDLKPYEVLLDRNECEVEVTRTGEPDLKGVVTHCTEKDIRVAFKSGVSALFSRNEVVSLFIDSKHFLGPIELDASVVVQEKTLILGEPAGRAGSVVFRKIFWARFTECLQSMCQHADGSLEYDEVGMMIPGYRGKQDSASVLPGEAGEQVDQGTALKYAQEVYEEFLQVRLWNHTATW